MIVAIGSGRYEERSSAAVFVRFPGPRVVPLLSRLDRMIHRLLTQRACLEWALHEIAAVPGPILEFGLGIGRSYDHLRRHVPERDIFVFDRVIVAREDCIPPVSRLIMGDFEVTVPAAAQRFAGRAALVHADVGGHDGADSRALASALVPFWAQMLRGGGLLLCDQPVATDGLENLPLPAGAPGHYHILRKHILARTAGEDLRPLVKSDPAAG